MSLQTGRYPSFLGGASQQDDSVRNPTQVTDAVNAWLHPALGAGKRPGAEFVAVLRHDLPAHAMFHSIQRDGAERYLVAIADGQLRVFDHETGYEYDVVMSEGSAAYLSVGDLQPWTVFRASTTADTTFIVNVNKTVAMDGRAVPGYIRGHVQTFAELPKPEDSQFPIPPGAIYEIRGAEGNAHDNYWVQRQGEGVWMEVAKPGAPSHLDPKTMPHVLRRVPDEFHGDRLYFTFGPQEWDARYAGSVDSVPPPSFVGERITDVFHHRGRLGMVTAENVAMSEIDHPFNFWRTTTQSLLDSDPVDFAVTARSVPRLQFAVPFQSALLLFGDRGNFQMTAEPMLTPQTPKVDPLGNYPSSQFVRPLLLGDSLYSVSDAGKHVVVREFFVDEVSILGDAADVTSHVPRYIPGRVRALATSPNTDQVFLATDAGSHIYNYSVRWSGTDKVQSAWSRWDLSGVGRVLHMEEMDGYLYLVAASPAGGCELLRVPLTLAHDIGGFADGAEFLLDRLALTEPAYYEFGNYTDIPLPYTLDSLEGVVVARTSDWDQPGELLDVSKATLRDGGMTIRFQGNEGRGRLAVGLAYENRVQLSRPYLRDGRNEAVLVGRLQVKDIVVAYKDAAYFELEVHTPGRGRDPQQYLAAHAGLFTARTLGHEMFRLGSPTFHSGERRLPVLSRADACQLHLVNRLPYQCWLQSAQFRAVFTTRSSI